MSTFAISYSDDASELAEERLCNMHGFHVRLTFASGVQHDVTLVGPARMHDGMLGIEYAEVYAPVDSDDLAAMEDADKRAIEGRTQKARLYDDVIDVHIY